MLEQLGIQPGERLLELGAATGYNAALMATLTGPDGHVTTIDIDEDLVTGAREHLAAASINNIEVVIADGALGHPETAPVGQLLGDLDDVLGETALDLPPHPRRLTSAGRGGTCLAPM